MTKRKETPAQILAKLESARQLAAARREVARIESIGATAKVAREHQPDGTIQWVARGRRIDVFQLLLERKAIPQDSFNAVRAYEEDLATKAGMNTPERRPDHIRGSQSGPPGQNVGDIQMDAYDRCKWVEDRLTTRDWRLLSALLHENDGSPERWRDTVRRITGEMRDEAHAAAVRHAAANLKDVRDRYHDGRRMAA